MNAFQEKIATPHQPNSIRNVYWSNNDDEEDNAMVGMDRWGKASSTSFSSTIELEASMGVYVRGGQYSNNMYYASPYLELLSSPNPDKVREIYLQFDLSRFGDGSLLEFGQLELSLLGGFGLSFGLTVEALYDHNWTRFNLTYNNRPTRGQIVTQPHVVYLPAYGDKIVIELHHLISKSVGNNLSLRIFQTAGVHRLVTFASSGVSFSNQRPRLVMRLQPPQQNYHQHFSHPVPQPNPSTIKPPTLQQCHHPCLSGTLNTGSSS